MLDKFNSLKVVQRGSKQPTLETLSPREDEHWQSVEQIYSHYPSVRHRWRFILKKIKPWSHKPGALVFDYGCGNGGLLLKIRDTFGLNNGQIYGCDASQGALKMAEKTLKINSEQLSLKAPIDKKFDLIICAEVIEHTQKYAEILDWISTHLQEGGSTVITTQSGKIHASDRYTGHTQHFKMASLISEMRTRGFKIQYKRNWGFPFFTLQKYLTNFQFNSVRDNYLEGEFSGIKRFVFFLAYCIFFLNHLMPGGPQIYIIATKE